MKLKGYNGNPRLRPEGMKIEYTKEQLSEVLKCSKDPLYFIDNYVKIVSIDKGFIPFQTRPFQKKLLKSFHKNRKTIGLLSRQVGKSTVVAAYFLWSILFNNNYTTAILANKESTAKEIFQKITLAYEALPLWMQQGIIAWNKTSVELENKSRVIVSSTSSSAIRGFTINLMVLDEFAFVKKNVADEFWTSVYPTISSGETSKIIIISTPNGYNLFWKLYDEAVQGINGFEHFKYTWEVVPERGLKWKKDQINTIGEQKFSQEHEVEFLGSTNTLIRAKDISEIAVRRPLYESDDLKVYEEPIFNNKYLVVADTAKGNGGDYSAFIVFNITQYPFSVCAVYRNNEISPLLYPNIIYRVAKKYNDAYVLIETNNNGQEVANILYNDFEYENMIAETYQSKEMGVMTTKLTKRLGCSNFKDLVENKKVILHDMELKAEIAKFIHQKNSYSAEDGYHDDLVMCCVNMAWFIRTKMFESISDNNLSKILNEEKARMIEESVLPFGFIEDGLDNILDPLSRILQGKPAQTLDDVLDAWLDGDIET